MGEGRGRVHSDRLNLDTIRNGARTFSGPSFDDGWGRVGSVWNNTVTIQKCVYWKITTTNSFDNSVAKSFTFHGFLQIKESIFVHFIIVGARRQLLVPGPGGSAAPSSPSTPEPVSREEDYFQRGCDQEKRRGWTKTWT